MILCSTDAFEESEYASIDTFLKQKLDGIIFIHSSGLSEEKQEKICQRICEAELPLVFIDVPKEYPDLSTVKTDHLHGSYLAVKYLLELGHRRIGCLTGPQNQTRSAQLQGLSLIHIDASWQRISNCHIGSRNASKKKCSFTGHVDLIAGIHNTCLLYTSTDWSKTAYINNGSHGCINMRDSEAATLYEMLETGTPVIMYYTEPYTLVPEEEPT